MKVSVQQQISASPADVWRVITDIENAHKTITGIVKLEVLHKPASGLLGLKWRETRVMFGKEAHETMWITAVEEGQWYDTRAESHGAIYTSRLSLESSGEKTILTMTFASQPVSFTAKLFSVLGFLFSGSIKKMLQKDLEDIAKVATV